MTLRSTEYFRREQADLLRQVERLPAIAHELPSLPIRERIEAIERVTTFLVEILLPHAELEQRILYPGADRLLGDVSDGGAVAHDRQEVRTRLAELAEADPADEGALQEILYALYALLTVHLQHEAEVYLRLVQTQPDEHVQRLFRRVVDRSPSGRPAA
jgi:hypothetical protein